MHIRQLSIQAVKGNWTSPGDVIYLIRLPDAKADVEALTVGPFTNEATRG
jgi:hypothetical protein